MNLIKPFLTPTLRHNHDYCQEKGTTSRVYCMRLFMRKERNGKNKSNTKSSMNIPSVVKVGGGNSASHFHMLKFMLREKLSKFFFSASGHTAIPVFY